MRVHVESSERGKENGGNDAGMARLAGIEPATLGFGGQYSIH